MAIIKVLLSSLLLSTLCFSLTLAALTVLVQESSVPSTDYIENALEDLKQGYTTEATLKGVCEFISKKQSERYFLQNWHVTVNPDAYYFKTKHYIIFAATESVPTDDRPALQTYVVFST